MSNLKKQFNQGSDKKKTSGKTFCHRLDSISNSHCITQRWFGLSITTTKKTGFRNAGVQVALVVAFPLTSRDADEDAGDLRGQGRSLHQEPLRR